jgi:hypothetical protein
MYPDIGTDLAGGLLDIVEQPGCRRLAIGTGDANTLKLKGRFTLESTGQSRQKAAAVLHEDASRWPTVDVILYNNRCGPTLGSVADKEMSIHFLPTADCHKECVRLHLTRIAHDVSDFLIETALDLYILASQQLPKMHMALRTLAPEGCQAAFS